ncbi:hypothetical protein STCU_03238 [Strigomonas culicis]|uniref:Uncharacterized protein n=1 Tax=Strigomonas culicis TaxID=28005 RepID=S9ULQ7_9TRYP|nr:hypothetical protein STCU_03238 [Strigomonas culicis]|eukprot:EPY31787.1 hypothetical protein STCU_03238 [Strigomonas culicis]
MNLITTYFKVKRVPGSVFIGEASLSHQTQRQAEYLYCLARNTAHPDIKYVHLLVEGMESYEHLRDNVLQPASSSSSSLGHRADIHFTRAQRHKIIPVVQLAAQQPLYADLFYYANQLLPQQLVVVCNADVYLSSPYFTLAQVQTLFDSFRDAQRGRQGEKGARSRSEAHGAPQLALALTRYESERRDDAPLIHDYRGSHDAFVLKAPLPIPFLQGVQHVQNCYQAENVVIHELHQQRYCVVNPCLDLRVIHKHEADLRQWLPSVDSARYARAEPATIQQCVKSFLQ